MRNLLLSSTLTIAAVALAATTLHAQGIWDGERPDGHTPIGVPHGQLVPTGRFVIGYRYDYARFDHLRRDTERVEVSDVLALGYTRAPETLNAHTHVAEVAYGPTADLTLLLELPYVHRNMDQQRHDGIGTGQSVSGLGDLRIGALYRAWQQGPRQAHVGLLVGLPTGATDHQDDAGSSPYAMQPGSGTFDLNPAITVVSQGPTRSWGARVGGALRLGESAEGFALGNRLDLTAWSAWRILTWASGSVRVAGDFWGDVDHEVDEFPRSPAAEPAFTGGERVELIVGTNLHAAAGIFQGHRLFAELGVPIYQSLDGPQLGLAWRGLLGWRWSL
jgi:hypothetical protein